MLICINCGSRSFLPANVTSSHNLNQSVYGSSQKQPSIGVNAKAAAIPNHRLRVGVVPLVQAKHLSRPVVIGLVSFVIVLFLLLIAGGDTLADVAVNLTPTSNDREKGRQSDEYKTAANASLPAHHQFSKEINEIGQRLVSAIPGGTSHQYSFNVIPSDEVNAFAMPGGDIFVFTGLLKLVGTKDQLAAVLAHEIQHVENRHSMRAHYRALGRVGLFTMLFGIFGDGSAVQITQISLLKHSRTLETDADLSGLKLLHAAGIPREAMVKSLTSLASQGGSGLPAWLSDHPDGTSRVRAVATAPLN